jgi:hypothetical protein
MDVVEGFRSDNFVPAYPALAKDASKWRQNFIKLLADCFRAIRNIRFSRGIIFPWGSE